MIAASKSPILEKLFVPYTNWALRRQFHAVHLLGDLPQLPADVELPLLVAVNHSSWWDVMLGIYLIFEHIGWESYAVMDERQLQRYRFFARLGMIGADRTSLAGVKEFLRYAERLLAYKRRALYLTVQGEFVSNICRPIEFQPGIAALARQLGECFILTMTFHYEFWNEAKPEAFVSFSPVTRLSTSPDFDRRAFLHAQERIMEAQIDTLLAAVQKRDPAAFRILLRSGRANRDHSAVQTPKYGGGKR